MSLQEAATVPTGTGDGALGDGALPHLEWPAVAACVHERLASPAARARTVTDDGAPDPDRLLPRATDPGVVADRLRAIEGLEVALGVIAARGSEGRISISSALLEVVDVSAWVRRAAVDAVLDLVELAGVTDVLVSARTIAGALAAVDHDELRGVDPDRRAALAEVRVALAPLAPPEDLTAALHRSIERGGEPRIADAASDVLGRLRARAKQARRSLVATAERMIKRESMRRALADGYWTEREGRVVLPVRSDAFSRAGGQGTVSGIIHGASGSGQTLFVEPSDLVDDNNAVREASTAVAAEERRIATRLSRRIGAAAPALQAVLDAAVHLDRVHAHLRLGRDLNAHAPTVTSPEPGASLVLPEARHPLMVLHRDPERGEVVPNDLRVDVGGALVLSGPNAGGKTVALKTIGLCVLMAQAGLRLPTGPGATVPLFPTVVTDVGDDQSIAANLSTFSAHIGHVLEAFAACDRGPGRPLVLLDEVAVGTDPDQGSALAEAILCALVERGATLVVTTHYERLKLLSTADPRFTNAAVGFDLETLRPTFRVRVGAPGSSSALAVSARLGVPDHVLAHAETLLADSRVRVDALLQEIEAERERLRQVADDLAVEQRRIDAERETLARREQRAEESAAAKRKKAHDIAAAQLRGLEDEIKQRRKALRRRGPAVRDEAGVTDADARDLARDVRARLHETGSGAEPSTTTAPAVATLAVGERVRVASLDADGDIVAIKGDKITVQVGPIKTTVTRADLHAPSKKAHASTSRLKPAPRPLEGPDPRRFFGPDAQVVQEGIDNVVDIRGARVDEALTMVEVFLDRALAEDRDVVILRHGHGSGALRKVVREHLPRLQHVARHRPGLPVEGGDAVTVVLLRS